MEKNVQLYLQTLFPHFSSPLISRFSELFNEISNNSINTINKKNKNELISENENKNLNGNYIIYPQKIKNGLEKRTMIIIKGIPVVFGCFNFYGLLTKFCNEINFFYIPGFALAKWDYVYAFVNTDSKKGVLNIFYGINVMKKKYKFYKGYDFSNLEIYFCKLQNVYNLLKKYQHESNQNAFVIKK